MKNKERIERLEAEVERMKCSDKCLHVEDDCNPITINLCTNSRKHCEHQGIYLGFIGKICLTPFECKYKQLHSFKHVGYYV